MLGRSVLALRQWGPADGWRVCASGDSRGEDERPLLTFPVPQTKGKSLEQIEAQWRSAKHP
jgi:hypothetical protein